MDNITRGTIISQCLPGEERGEEGRDSDLEKLGVLSSAMVAVAWKFPHAF